MPIKKRHIAIPATVLTRNGNGRPSKSPTASNANSKKTAYHASIFPGDSRPIPEGFAKLVRKLEAALRMPVWFLIQNADPACCPHICIHLFKGFQSQKNAIQDGQPIALLIESPGGDAHMAYRIARLIQRRTDKFTVLVPQYAKSAATLLALGASNLILGQDAELGPLDVQMFDREREDFSSALDAVQSLERLNVFSLTAIDQLIQLMSERTGKKLDTLLPLVLNYANQFVRPLLEKIDTVDYTKKSRELKVAEEYAVRLMQKNYPFKVAKQIAAHLVDKYPTHGFVIDAQEAQSMNASGETFGLGLKTAPASKEVQSIFEEMQPYLDSLTMMGRLLEVKL